MCAETIMELVSTKSSLDYVKTDTGVLPSAPKSDSKSQDRFGKMSKKRDSIQRTMTNDLDSRLEKPYV